MGIAAVSCASTNASLSVASIFNDQRKGAEAIPAASTPVTPTRVIFNPQSRYDAGAGVFVTEYRNIDTGDIERQIPDRRQLRAYEDAQRLKSQSAASAETTARPSSKTTPVVTSMGEESTRATSQVATSQVATSQVATSQAAAPEVPVSASVSSPTAAPQLVAVRV